MPTVRVPVFVEEWQVACCGTPPSVGDRVRWSVILAEPEEDDGPDPASEVRLAALATPYPVAAEDAADVGGLRPRPDRWPTQLAADGLHALWWSPRPVQGPVEVAGRLLEDHHGGVPDGFPLTVGTVARVRVRSQEYVPHPTEPRRYGLGPTPPRYRDVERGPVLLSASYGTTGPYWEDSGYLVDLAVDRDGPPRLRP